MSIQPRSRRSFLAGALATSAAVALPARAASAAPRARRYVEDGRIDLHGHYLAPQYVASLAAHGRTTIGGIPIPAWTPQLHRNFMANYGIAFTLLSVSDPGVSFLEDPAEALALAQSCNDYIAGVVRDDPSHFGAFALLPLQTPAAARTEAIRCLDDLAMEGVGLLSSFGGKYLGDPVYDDLLAELNRRKTWVFVHPTAVSDDDKPTYSVPDFIAEYPFDTARTIISLFVNGTFKKYPDIRWHFAHGGGAIPMLRFRLAALAANAAVAVPVLGLPAGAATLKPTDATDLLAAQRYDTGLIADPPELEAVNVLAGAKQLYFGSDWPFAQLVYKQPGDPQPALSEVFDDGQRRLIDKFNAQAAFPRLKRRVGR